MLTGEPSASTAGTASYTVGQRQGTGVAVGEARYVRQTDPSTIKLGRQVDLETSRLEVCDVKFVSGAAPADSGGAPDAFRAEVQIRHRGRVAPATVRPTGDGRWLVEGRELGRGRGGQRRGGGSSHPHNWCKRRIFGWGEKPDY